MATVAEKTTWFSRAIRWTLGLVFIITGIQYLRQEGWPVLVFGIIIFATGFLKPRRCIEDKCDL